MTKIQVNSQGKAYLTTASKALAGVQPTLVTKSITENGTYNASSDNADGYSSVTVNVSGGGGSTKYGCTVDNLLGNVDANGKLQLPTEQTDLVFTGVVDIVNYGLYYKFYKTGVKSASFPDLTTISGNSSCYFTFSGCTSLTSVSLPSLTTISNLYGCYYMFSGCTSLTSVSLPSLTTISGMYACDAMFSNCANLTSVSFPSLTTISGNYCCSDMFFFSKAISDIYFNALTTTSFGTNTDQFSAMLSSTGTNVTHTVHFPSNLTSTISGLSGYPLFGGTSGYVIIAFDLPATT